jgi:transglutaminase-like putative cysteine protease
VATVNLARWRIVATIVLGALVAVVAGGAFDAVQWPLFVPVAVVGLAALLVSERRPAVRVPTAVVAAIAGVSIAVLLADGSLADSVRALVRGPRQLLTTEWPSPAVPSVVGAVALLLAVTTAVSADLAGRPRLHLAPLAPMVIAWVASLAIGAPVRPATWVTLLAGATALWLALARRDAAAPATSRVARLDRTVTVSATAIVVAALGTAGAVAWADRADPRQIEEAETNAALLDPIEAMVALRRADPPFNLFSITDRSRLVGQSPPTRWRIAALDSYDGQRWVPRLTLRPIGGRLGIPAPLSADRPPPVSYDLEFLSDDLALLPFPGPPLSANIDVETDVDRVAVRAIERPRVGTTVAAESEVALTSRSSPTTRAVRRQVDDIALGFSEQATRLAGQDTETEAEQLRRIESTMREGWQLDSDAPGGGQQLALIERFVENTNRGTREQFVTAFVLLVRSLGFDARIATGFVVPPADLGSPLVLRSTMASVWPEVSFEGLGWVAFDPVPEVEADQTDEPTPQPEAQTPAAAQPPIAPPTDEVDDEEDSVVQVDTDVTRWAAVRPWLAWSGVIAGLGLLPILAAAAAILAVKWRRRHRRLVSGDPARRIRGAWANATDSLVDAGLTIAPSWTDDLIAEHAVAIAPTVPTETHRLARLSTIATFGSSGPSVALADEAISTSDTIGLAIRTERTWWGRVRWRLSLRSLRAHTRSPVMPEA